MDLLAPKTSHMDFNIGCALHFASKGEGFLFDPIFYESEKFLEIKSLLEAPVEGDKSSYDYGLVTNKIQQIDPELYYFKNEAG